MILTITHFIEKIYVKLLSDSLSKVAKINMYSGLISFSESGLAGKIADNKDVLKPYMTIFRAKGSVKIEFDLEKQEAIQLFSKRASEKEFVLLTETNQSPYIDNRPNLTEYSETREYKAVFSKNGNLIGDEDLLKIRTKGRFRFF